MVIQIVNQNRGEIHSQNNEWERGTLQTNPEVELSLNQLVQTQLFILASF